MLGNDGLLTRRLALVTGGDDQCMTLVIADFESTMSMARAARSRKRAKQQQLFRKSLSSNNLNDNNSATKTALHSRASGWRFNVVREVLINTAHVASIRSVAITPIITPCVVEYFTKLATLDKNENMNMDMDMDMDGMILRRKKMMMMMMKMKVMLIN